MLTMRRRDNIMIKRVVCVGALCLAFAGASLQAGTLILGDPPMPNTGNCDPFGCPAFFGLGTYQQVYLSTAFPGAITIDALTHSPGRRRALKMAENTKIQWTSATWNPVRGCTRVSPGCGGPGKVGGCYA